MQHDEIAGRALGTARPNRSTSRAHRVLRRTDPSSYPPHLTRRRKPRFRCALFHRSLASFSRLAGATMRCQEPPPLHELHRLSVGAGGAAGRNSLPVCGLFESICPRAAGRFFGYPTPLISSLNASEIAPRKFQPHSGRHLRPDLTFPVERSDSCNSLELAVKILSCSELSSRLP